MQALANIAEERKFNNYSKLTFAEEEYPQYDVRRLLKLLVTSRDRGIILAILCVLESTLRDGNSIWSFHFLILKDQLKRQAVQAKAFAVFGNSIKTWSKDVLMISQIIRVLTVFSGLEGKFIQSLQI